MQKSIFKRYLGMTMIIVVLSFVMLGSMMMLFFTSYWQGEKKELLTQNASSVSNVVGKAMARQGETLPENYVPFMEGYLASFSASIDADIFITDLNGNVVLGNYANSNTAPPAQVPIKAVEQAVKGLYEGKNNFGGLYRTRYYIIGVPMSAGTAEGEETCVGAVFAATSISSINSFRRDLIRIFMIAALAVLAVTFCVVGAFAYSMVKPLRQLSAAARSFGAGDFSVRVPVTSTDELGQLAASFNNMANSLSTSEGTRRSFIANVSHELKTPMTTIAGFIDGILDGTIARDQQDRYLRIVSNEVKRLSRLVRSMLDLSRIDNGEMRLHSTKFDITDVIVTTLLTFEQSISEKKIEVRGLEDAPASEVYGDRDLLYQVVYNLAENAVKFTPENGYIAIQVIDSVDRVTVVIENSGQGIDPEELPRIFERFYKTDQSRSRDKNGLGLGLYIVRTVLQLHGGDIAVSSVTGEYCRFEFYLPKPAEQPKLKEVKEQKPKEQKKGKQSQGSSD